MGDKVSSGQEFRPELLSRRGEFTAWILTSVIFVVVLIFRTRTPKLSISAYLFLGFFLLAALIISLGNWMDRQTEIMIDDQHIGYKNGLRRSQLAWDQIEKVVVTPSQLGEKVHVVGNTSHFHFRMMGEIKYQGQTRGRVGFPAGEEILQTILEKSGLIITKSEIGDPLLCASVRLSLRWINALAAEGVFLYWRHDEFG